MARKTNAGNGIPEVTDKMLVAIVGSLLHAPKRDKRTSEPTNRYEARCVGCGSKVDILGGHLGVVHAGDGKYGC